MGVLEYLYDHIVNKNEPAVIWTMSGSKCDDVWWYMWFIIWAEISIWCLVAGSNFCRCLIGAIGLVAGVPTFTVKDNPPKLSRKRMINLIRRFLTILWRIWALLVQPNFFNALTLQIIQLIVFVFLMRTGACMYQWFWITWLNVSIYSSLYIDWLGWAWLILWLIWGCW